MKKMILHRLFVRSVYLIATLLLISPSLPNAADFGVRGGVYPDENQPFLGAEAVFDVTKAGRWFGNPNVEHAFVDRGDLTAVSSISTMTFQGEHPTRSGLARVPH